MVPELNSTAGEAHRLLADLEERNRELERSLLETREKLEAAVGQLSQEIRERMAINRSLETALQNFRDVLEKSASGVIIVDHQGVTRYGNPVAAEMLGRNRVGMVGEVFGVPVSEEDIELDLIKEGGNRAVARMRVIPTSWEGDDAHLILLRDVTLDKSRELELNRVSRALNAVYRCSEAIVHSKDEKTLLKDVCQIIVDIGGYSMAWIGFVSGDGNMDLHPVAQASVKKRSAPAISWREELECGHIREAIQTGKACVVSGVSGGGSGNRACQAMADLGCISAATIPLIWGGRVIGVINICASGEGAFDSAEIEMLGRLADDLSHGVASLRTSAEREQIQENLRFLSTRLVQIQEEERRDIARELHDEIGQSLTALKIGIDRALQRCQTCGDDLAGASREVAELIARVRNLSLSLRPTMLDDLGLVPTLKWYFDRYTARTGVRVNFSHGRLPRALPRDVVTAAYRIVQEALTNVARHAQAGEVMVGLHGGRRFLSIGVRDDGVGFDLDRTQATSGIGLSGMRERTLSLGGTLSIESNPGSGTYLLAEIPLILRSGMGRGKKDGKRSNNRSTGR